MKTLKWMSALAFVLVVMIPKAEAMTMNLAMKWDDVCSGPQTPFLCFYSPQRDTQGDGAAGQPGTRLVGRIRPSSLALAGPGRGERVMIAAKTPFRETHKKK